MNLRLKNRHDILGENTTLYRDLQVIEARRTYVHASTR